VDALRGPTILRIAKAFPIRTLPCPAVMGAPCARTCNPAQLRDRHNLARLRDSPNLEALPPQRERNEWAIGRLRPTLLAPAGARSAEFATAARRARTATTDIRASAQPAVEAPRRAEEGPAAAAVEATAVVVEATAVVVEATAAVVGTGKSEGKPWQA